MKKSIKSFLSKEDTTVGGTGSGPPVNNISSGHVSLFDPIMKKKGKKFSDIQRRSPPVK